MVYLTPSVYNIAKTSEGAYMCVPESAKFQVAKKLYGRMKNDVVRIWNAYVCSIQEGRGSNGAIFVGHKGSGKALKNGTLVRVLNGWKAIEDLTEDDLLETPDGKYTSIFGSYPQGIVDLYDVVFEDGRKCTVCIDHLWKIYNMDNNGKEEVINTKHILETLNITNGHCKLYIDLCTPVFYSTKDTTHYLSVVDNIRKGTYTSLPRGYLNGGIHDREMLIRALLSDYTPNEMPKGSVVISNKTVANDLVYVVRSLGGICHNEETDKGYKLTISFSGEYGKKLRIKSISKTEPGEATCIAVRNSKKLFIADDFIVTHNTEAAYNIGNIAIENGLPAIKVVNIQADIALVRFLSGLGDCVLIFDEFGKNFQRDLQDKMLTMLGDKNLGNKICVITENEILQLSNFIVGRSGRILHLHNYSRTYRDVIDEFCTDNNVSQKFYNELVAVYDKALTFSYDDLQTMVIQHLRYPNEPLAEMLTYLNVDLKQTERYYYLNSVTRINEADEVYAGKPIVFSNNEIPKENFDRGVSFWVTIEKPVRESFKITKDNVTNISDDSVTLEASGFRIIINKQKSRVENNGGINDDNWDPNIHSVF